MRAAAELELQQRLQRAIKNDLRRESQCTGKTAFDNFSAALEIARRSSSRRKVNLKPYRCKYCHQFHIGSVEWAHPKYA